jgi:hypothetical protein
MTVTDIKIPRVLKGSYFSVRNVRTDSYKVLQNPSKHRIYLCKIPTMIMETLMVDLVGVSEVLLRRIRSYNFIQTFCPKSS